MARVKTYNHTRFDGGMTHNRRDTSDLTRLGLISHLDIYKNKNEMSVMPGYVDDMGYSSNSTGLKTYDTQAFGRVTGDDARIFALAKKSNGTGSKIFTRVLTDSEWTIPSGGYSTLATEGTADLIDYPFFWWNGSADFNYPVKSGGNTTVAQHGANAADYNATWQSWLTNINTKRTYAVNTFTGTTYLAKGNQTGVSSITSSAVTVNAKTTSIFSVHLASGNYQVGIVGALNTPRRSQALLWDSASLLADQNIAIGKGDAVVVGYPSGIWSTVSVSASSDLEANGKDEMTVRVLSGENQETIYKLPSVSEIDATTNVFALNDQYQDSMLWYGKVEVSSGSYLEGIWALGKGDLGGQFGVSLLLDTSSLGLVRNASLFGYSMYLIHNEDGSVSRLDNFQTGTYDVPATIETLIYGADSPYQKELRGVSLVTEDLPSGGSVGAYYRTDEDNSWVELGTSDTVGKQRHSFTKAEGTPVGKFQEIEFRFVITGKVTVKNIRVDIIETDNLPY